MRSRDLKALSLSVNALKIPAALVNFVGCGSIASGAVGFVSVASVDFVSIGGASIVGLCGGALRVRAGAGAGRIRSGRLLLDQDTVSSTIGRNDGYHTTVFVRTTGAFGARRELRGELRAADRGDRA